MTVLFLLNYTTTLFLVFILSGVLTPNNLSMRFVFYTTIVLVVTLACWRWGRLSVIKRGKYIYIQTFPTFTKISAEEVENLIIIEKHVLVNRKDGRQSKHHFMFGPSGGIHSSVISLIINQIKRL
ncbi:hypothetical protein [Salinimonas sediminis]|uniref:Uncharacterized protein n=1 Tax=Salinimonas sediminis TaxID=2303538 RepID=A0A346NLC5_9ALTE|nr:hypothetical protein [Salinimonas sediminis]AXR06332.1 hypothetical protein D0Y50_08115 [Salinimonas sediminis]